MSPAERRAVIAEYDELGLSSKEIADLLGCSRRTVHRARSKRRAAGDDWTWTGPEPDHAAVARAVAGDPPDGLTPAERHAAIAQCDRLGLPTWVIADRVGCSTQAVYYARAKRAA
ncbi:helix-turn-helix domain-containing protein [Streptomyces sp. MMS24-I31]|uniref:helix-turn-helix domain-containing protein n=1 Tax=Streptomyces sp. MMS24-I31 TaxID=3351563 RepID=UPI003896EF51